MNKLSFYLGVTLISLFAHFACFAQVCVPDLIAGKIIDELLVKDHLEFVVEKQDSSITVLIKMNDEKSLEIKILKTNEEAQKSIIAKLEEVIKLREAENKDLQKQLNKVKSKGLIAHVLTGLVILVGIIGISQTHK